jgi:hypothetical protein
MGAAVRLPNEKRPGPLPRPGRERLLMTTDDIAQTGPDQPHAHCTGCGRAFDPTPYDRVLPWAMQELGHPLVWLCENCQSVRPSLVMLIQAASMGATVDAICKVDHLVRRLGVRR